MQWETVKVSIKLLCYPYCTAYMIVNFMINPTYQESFNCLW